MRERLDANSAEYEVGRFLEMFTRRGMMTKTCKFVSLVNVFEKKTLRLFTSTYV